MESNQLNNQVSPNEEALFELLTLDCEIDEYGSKYYRNKEGKLHRIHGPALIEPDGEEWWFKNGDLHREDGPAVIWSNGYEKYYINDHWLTRKQFIQWQKENGIKPTY